MNLRHVVRVMSVNGKKFKIENDQTSNATARQPYLSRNFKEIENVNQYQEGITEEFRECKRFHRVVYHSRQDGGYIACFDCKNLKNLQISGLMKCIKVQRTMRKKKAAAGRYK